VRGLFSGTKTKVLLKWTYNPNNVVMVALGLNPQFICGLFLCGLEAFSRQ
jgi:hypothetical protein